MTSLLVTGGAGVIGSHLVRHGCEAMEVVVLDDLSSGCQVDVDERARLVVGSVVDDAALDEAFSKPPDVVAHLAALFANQKSVEQPVEDLLVNGLGTLKVLERARVAGTSKVVICSSSCVYAPTGAATGVRGAETPYAITKGLGEEYARYYSHQFGMDVVIVRPFNAYGPPERPGPYRNVVPNFIATALRKEPLIITGTGDETRDFTYVEDIAVGILSALTVSGPSGGTFDLGTGRETTISELAHRVNVLTDNPAGVTFVPRRSWDTVERRVAEVEAARLALGFVARTQLEAGLELTLEWLSRPPA